MWFKDAADAFHFILPDGSVCRWDSQVPLVCNRKVAQLTSLYNQFPHLLFDSIKPTWLTGGEQVVENKLAAHLDSIFRLRKDGHY